MTDGVFRASVDSSAADEFVKSEKRVRKPARVNETFSIRFHRREIRDRVRPDEI